MLVKDRLKSGLYVAEVSQSGLLLRPDQSHLQRTKAAHCMVVLSYSRMENTRNHRGELQLLKIPYILFWCFSFPITQIKSMPGEVPFWAENCLVG